MNRFKTQIDAFMQAHQSEMLEKLETFVRLESYFGEKEHVEQCMNWLKREFEEEGFSCEVTGSTDEYAGVLIGILGAERQGKPVVFTGHVDTVHPKNSFGPTVWRVEDGKAYGPGVLDMKGGIIISLYVAKALNAIGFNARPIKIIYAGDEECDHIGTDGDTILTEHAKGAICAFNMETGQLENKLCTGRKSLYNVFATVHGVGGHSGNFFEQGKNAVHEAVLKTCQMIPLTDLAKGSTVTTSVLRGGDVQAKIPDRCEIVYDVRYATPAEGVRLYESVKKIMETTYVAGTSTEYRIDCPKFKPYEENAAVQELLEFVNHVSVENGYPKFASKRMGACSDAGNIQAAGTPVLDCCGVVGEFNHSTQEYAFIDSLYKRVIIWSLVIIELQSFA